MATLRNNLDSDEVVKFIQSMKKDFAKKKDTEEETLHHQAWVIDALYGVAKGYRKQPETCLDILDFFLVNGLFKGKALDADLCLKRMFGLLTELCVG